MDRAVFSLPIDTCSLLLIIEPGWAERVKKTLGRVSITDILLSSFHGPRDKSMDRQPESSLRKSLKRLKTEVSNSLM